MEAYGSPKIIGMVAAYECIRIPYVPIQLIQTTACGTCADREHVIKTLRSDKGICVNNLTISVVTYEWDGQQVRALAKDLAECPLCRQSASITKITNIFLFIPVLSNSPTSLAGFSLLMAQMMKPHTTVCFFGFG